MKSARLALAFGALSIALSAQDTRGNISGTVTDPQGAVVAGAAVAVTNTGMNTSVNLTTNAGGYFEAPLLLPGSYSVTVTAAGFKKSVRSGLNLGLGEQLQVPFQLEVGGTTESVTITAEAPMLDTSTVTTGRAMTNREVMDLPVLGNNIVMLTRMAPGVQVPGTTQFLVQGMVGGGSGYNMAGGVGGNEWSIDGASTNGTDRRVSVMPSPDVVDEFKIETSNFDASFGHATGLGISMSTKSGANAFHGTATYQYYNQRWNAASFFVKQQRYAQIAAARAANNIALADELADRPLMPAGHMNNYAGTFSGPVYIPKVFDGRNKVFFFLGYSGLRNQQSARPSEINYTVPTDAMRAGDYSQLLNVDPVRYQVYDPLSARVDPARAGHWVRDPFPGNIIARSRFNNPMYDFYNKRMPIANNNPTDPRREPFNNYLATGMPNNADYKAWTNRFDYQASDRHRFFFRWLKSNYLEDAQDYTYETEPGLMAWNEKRNSLTGAVDWTWAKSASTVISTTIDTNYFLLQNQRLGTRKYKPTDVGLPAYMDVKCDASCVLPRVQWNGLSYWGSNDNFLSVPVDAGPKGRQQGIKSNITHIRGSHSLKGGIDFRQHFRTLLQTGGLTSGNFVFSNTFTRKDDDGNAPNGALGLNWAAFQLGLPNQMSVDTNDTFAMMNPYYAWFAQDTWRVARNLTVTFGLRMEYELGPTERYNRAISYFDPNLELPITALAQAAYARNPLPEVPASQFIVKGGTVYTGQNGVSRRLWRNELMWLPRVSAAWQMNSKTVIRGGYGTYFDTLNVMNISPDQYGFSRATSTVLTTDAGTTWLVGNPKAGVSPLTDPFPVINGQRFVSPLRDALGSMARVGQGYSFADFNRQHPRVQRWRAGIQRELGQNLMIEAAYWGQWADRINITQRLDFLPEQYWATGLVRNAANASENDRNVTNPFFINNFDSLRASNPTLYNHLSTLGFFTSPTVRKNVLLRPFPHMNGLNNTAAPIGKGRTHALEVNFLRRFARGFSLNASYTRMFQENKTILENEFNRDPSIWWPNNTSRPHRITATGIYELPFGRGRSYLTSGVLNHVLGGWQVAATFEYQPGPLLEWGNLFYYGNIDNFASDATSASKTLEQWFNTGVQFEKNAARTPVGNHVRVFPRYFNELRADGLTQWNGNLLRSFKIHERFNMQFRADALNLQNRSQMNPPDINPTSTNFGRITSQTASLNRTYQVQMRLQF